MWPIEHKAPYKTTAMVRRYRFGDCPPVPGSGVLRADGDAESRLAGRPWDAVHLPRCFGASAAFAFTGPSATPDPVWNAELLLLSKGSYLISM